MKLLRVLALNIVAFGSRLKTGCFGNCVNLR